MARPRRRSSPRADEQFALRVRSAMQAAAHRGGLGAEKKATGSEVSRHLRVAMRRFANALPSCLLSISFSLRATPGWAQVLEAQAAEAPAEAQVPEEPTDAEREAERLLEQARELFGRARFREALPLLERAHELSRSPRYLFNLGVLHHKLSDCEPAREYFERYLAEDPEGSARGEANWALQELYAHCPVARVPADPAPSGGVPPEPQLALPAASEGAVAAAAAPALVPSSRSTESGAHPSPRAWVFLGVGAAVGLGAVVSAGLQSRAQHDIDALHEQASRGDEAWDPYEAERASLSENARTYRRLSILLGIGCGVLVGTGTAFWILDSRSDSSIDVTLTTPGLSYRGRF
jgi:tetratricopeptide (TPR) repeat protein